MSVGVLGASERSHTGSEQTLLLWVLGADLLIQRPLLLGGRSALCMVNEPTGDRTVKVQILD